MSIDLAKQLINELNGIDIQDQKIVVKEFIGADPKRAIETIKGLYLILTDKNTPNNEFQKAYLAARQLQPFLNAKDLNQPSVTTVINRSHAIITELEDTNNIESLHFEKSLQMRELLADLAVKLPTLALGSNLTILNEKLDPTRVPTSEDLLNKGFMDEGKIAAARTWLKNRDVPNFPTPPSQMAMNRAMPSVPQERAGVGTGYAPQPKDTYGILPLAPEGVYHAIDGINADQSGTTPTVDKRGYGFTPKPTPAPIIDPKTGIPKGVVDAAKDALLKAQSKGTEEAANASKKRAADAQEEINAANAASGEGSVTKKAAALAKIMQDGGNKNTLNYGPLPPEATAAVVIQAPVAQQIKFEDLPQPKNAIITAAHPTTTTTEDTTTTSSAVKAKHPLVLTNELSGFKSSKNNEVNKVILGSLLANLGVEQVDIDLLIGEVYADGLKASPKTAHLYRLKSMVEEIVIKQLKPLDGKNLSDAEKKELYSNINASVQDKANIILRKVGLISIHKSGFVGENYNDINAINTDGMQRGNKLLEEGLNDPASWKLRLVDALGEEKSSNEIANLIRKKYVNLAINNPEEFSFMGRMKLFAGVFSGGVAIYVIASLFFPPLLFVGSLLMIFAFTSAVLTVVGEVLKGVLELLKGLMQLLSGIAKLAVGTVTVAVDIVKSPVVYFLNKGRDKDNQIEYFNLSKKAMSGIDSAMSVILGKPKDPTVTYKNWKEGDLLTNRDGLKDRLEKLSGGKMAISPAPTRATPEVARNTAKPLPPTPAQVAATTLPIMPAATLAKPLPVTPVVASAAPIAVAAAPAAPAVAIRPIKSVDDSGVTENIAARANRIPESQIPADVMGLASNKTKAEIASEAARTAAAPLAASMSAKAVTNNDTYAVLPGQFAKSDERKAAEAAKAAKPLPPLPQVPGPNVNALQNKKLPSDNSPSI